MPSQSVCQRLRPERVGPGLVIVGLLELSFSLALLVSDVPQVLLERGDFAEPLQAVGFFESFVGVAFDLEQAWHLGGGHAEHGAADAGFSELGDRSVPKPLILQLSETESVMPEESQRNVPKREPLRLPPQYCDFA
jgi:hypothetical protein